MIGNIIAQKGGKNVILVDDVLTKITTEEAWEIASTPNSPFMNFYKGNIDSAIRTLNTYLSKMDAEKNGYFTRAPVHCDQVGRGLLFCRVSVRIYAQYKI